MNIEFDFSHISITQPTSVQGGAYFTKIRYNGEPLYIQPSKCSTKQGLSETNKKAYIDLMFTNEDEEVIDERFTVSIDPSITFEIDCLVIQKGIGCLYCVSSMSHNDV